jgi:hypothetical protein
MESEVMEGETLVGRVRKWKKSLGKSIFGRGRFPKYSVPARECVPAQNKKKIEIQAQKSREQESEACFPIF